MTTALDLCLYTQSRVVDCELRSEDPGPWRDLVVSAWAMHEEERALVAALDPLGVPLPPVGVVAPG